MNGRDVCQRAEVGDRQRSILMRANAELVMTLDNKERMAARRLVRRGILRRQRFGSPSIGYITVYVIEP